MNIPFFGRHPAIPLASSVVLLSGGIGIAGFTTHLPNTRIAAGVAIAGIDVGGMTREEATIALQDTLARQDQAEIVLRHPTKPDTWRRTLGMLGADSDVGVAIDKAFAVGDAESIGQRIISGDKPRGVAISIPISVPEEASKAWLRQIAHQLNRLPTDAHAFAKKGVGLTIDRPHKSGIRVDMDATWNDVLLNGDGLFDGSEATVVLKTIEPKITNRDLSPLGTLWSAYFTNYASSSANRKSNLALAASKLDGHLLQPGEVFSYNNRVGPRTESRGWKTAHQFQDGQIVDGVGGGVCQSSSTLYNAVLMGGLRIVERHNHSLPVAYLSPARDASVSYGHLDFKFANNTDGPLYITAEADGKKFHIRLYGSLASRVPKVNIETTEPIHLPNGAYKVAAKRTIQHPDGRIETEDLGWDTYGKPKIASLPKPASAQRPTLPVDPVLPSRP
ncbi:MAG: VanW family protein [Armatimonadota bacterium]